MQSETLRSNGSNNPAPAEETLGKGDNPEMLFHMPKKLLRYFLVGLRLWSSFRRPSSKSIEM